MKKQTVFKSKDVAILRECLAGIYKKAPPIIQRKIHDNLLRFAESIKGYCLCEEKSFIDGENKFACLNCGKRHNKAEGDTKLEVLN